MLVTLGTTVVSFGRDVAEGMGRSDCRTFASRPERNLALCRKYKNKITKRSKWYNAKLEFLFSMAIITIINRNHLFSFLPRTFDRAFHVLVRVQNVLLDEFQWSWPM